MDWQNYYIEETLHMWGNEEKELLEELVSPVPSLFRDVAKQTIAGKIGELALQKNKTKISRDLIIEGYIIGTPKRDHRFLRNKLEELNIDRKSTRLNSSHVAISYAVSCLKKKIYCSHLYAHV